MYKKNANNLVNKVVNHEIVRHITGRQKYVRGLYIFVCHTIFEVHLFFGFLTKY